MICTHRIYKGEDVEFHIPFDVEDYTNLHIEFTTNGDYKVEAEEWAIEDGVIYVHFYGGDLDILPDGVIRETLTYELDGEDKVEQYTTNLYLKTPVGYSAMTPQDIYESGYTAGQEECVSATTEAYQSGYTEGLNTAGISYGNSGFTFSTSGVITVSEDISISIDDNDFLLNTDSNQYKYIDGVRMTFPHQSGYTYLLTAGIHTYEVRNIASFQISSGSLPPGLYITPRPNASYYDLTVQSFGNGVVTPQSQYFYVELKQY